MQRLRKNIKNNAHIWAISLVLSLIFVTSMQPHVHMHSEHQHEIAVTQHNHDTNLHQAHFGNSHDAEHNDIAHTEVGTYSIDIFPDGVNKSSIFVQLVCILVGILILLLPPPASYLLLANRPEHTPLIRRCACLPPQLRAPPR